VLRSERGLHRTVTKEREGENARLKRLLAEAELDRAILREAASGKY
jgi:putative transposase